MLFAAAGLFSILLTRCPAPERAGTFGVSVGTRSLTGRAAAPSVRTLREEIAADAPMRVPGARPNQSRAAEVRVRQLNFDLLRLQDGDRPESYGTRRARGYALAQAAETLHRLGYRGLRARGLKGRHVEALVAEWQRQGLSDGTTRNRLALRQDPRRAGAVPGTPPPSPGQGADAPPPLPLRP